MKKFGSIDFLILIFRSVNINCKLNGIDLDRTTCNSGVLSSLFSTLLAQVATVVAFDSSTVLSKSI